MFKKKKAPEMDESTKRRMKVYVERPSIWKKKLAKSQSDGETTYLGRKR